MNFDDETVADTLPVFQVRGSDSVLFEAGVGDAPATGGENAPLGSEGTLIVESAIPVVVTALRTQNGYPMSSYPVGIPGR